jgi:hypothetical protein
VPPRTQIWCDARPRLALDTAEKPALCPAGRSPKTVGLTARTAATAITHSDEASRGRWSQTPDPSAASRSTGSNPCCGCRTRMLARPGSVGKARALRAEARRLPPTHSRSWWALPRWQPEEVAGGGLAATATGWPSLRRHASDVCEQLPRVRIEAERFRCDRVSTRQPAAACVEVVRGYRGDTRGRIRVC